MESTMKANLEAKKKLQQAKQLIEEACALQTVPANYNHANLMETKQAIFNTLINDPTISNSHNSEKENQIDNIVGFVSNMWSWYGTPYVLLAARGLEDCNWHNESHRLFEMYDAMIESEFESVEDDEYETVSWWAD